MIQLPEHIITTHLAASVTSPTKVHPSVFIIASPSTAIVSTVHTQLQHSLQGNSNASALALKLLDSVQILQYFDFAGLAESVSEVAASLHELQASSGKYVAARKSASSEENPLILFIDGLGSALESTQRRSGIVHANALAASLLRSITHLSRSHPSLLVLLSLETSRDTRSGEDFVSAFSSSTGRTVSGVSPGGVLVRTLLSGIDTSVLVHDMVHSGLEDGDMIVEVIKDRVGGSLGCWAVWR